MCYFLCKQSACSPFSRIENWPCCVVVIAGQQETERHTCKDIILGVKWFLDILFIVSDVIYTSKDFIIIGVLVYDKGKEIKYKISFCCSKWNDTPHIYKNLISLKILKLLLIWSLSCVSCNSYCYMINIFSSAIFIRYHYHVLSMCYVK